MQPQAFDSAAFLRDYWQKKPCLVRNPWRDWRNPLDPDDLAGLACEDGMEARLITHKRGKWQVEHGPLSEKRFAKLGKHPWTLLVQAVDQIVPEVAALIEPFSFIPNWRIDDVMVSYASEGGGVGPHFDQYDVFLIQGLGKRRWQVGALCDADTLLMPHDDLRLLASFTATDEWLLEPGDILYLPPRFAHNGVAVGDDCMTYSIGFRAPSRAELIAHWADHILAELADDDRYADPDLAPQANPGEIAPAALDRLHSMVSAALEDRAAFGRWFGTFATAPKYPDADTAPDRPIGAKALRKALAAGVSLGRNPASRFAFVREAADSAALFVDGNCFVCCGAVTELAEQLGGQRRVQVDAALLADAAAFNLLTTLISRGALTLEPAD
ncbi:MAG: cupin domain-containing protein [Polymorphobacter sp.]